MSAAHRLAAVAAAEFHLVGVNGIDFIERSGVPYPIEINPRWSASMELVERALRRQRVRRPRCIVHAR